jgi:hypothetical protein
MSKRNRLRKEVQQDKVAAENSAPMGPLSLGDHTFRVFEGVDAAFGARLSDYPPMSSVPDGTRNHEHVASTLFFNGGVLEDYGLNIKPGLDRRQVMIAIRALLCSWDPKHEHKTAVVGWALSEWCDGTPKSRGAA